MSIPSSAETRKPNRLIHEKSPYLLQHAYNPVDWYPWGEEAFAKARAEDKPIFLSIGYSTCHWCHVMERESFEDPAVAAYLNEHFVSIKLDREERPDLDQIYMSYVMAVTGSGGWPMTVFMTADRKPFFGGTYFAPQDAYGRPGFRRLLEFITDAWTKKRDQVDQAGEDFVRHLEAAGRTEEPASGEAADAAKLLPNEGDLTRAFRAIHENYDGVHGGFSRAPKFPSPHVLLFILRYYSRTGDEDAFAAAEKTLQAMARGGMRDQLGGGFHRYSVDREWFVPHFEKMLYDQAMLLRAYTEMYQLTQDPFYAEVARGIADDVLGGFTDPAGGFYSALDADSLPPGTSGPDAHKQEGAFYVWRAPELRALLSGKEFKVAELVFGFKETGNVSADRDPHGEFTGANILKLERTAQDASRELEISTAEAERLLASAKAKLLAARSARPRPHLDDKVLADWNGLMIAHLAFASQALGEPRYLEAAERAAEFVIDRMTGPDGRLLRRYRAGEAGIAAQLDDVAFMAYAFLELYQADGREKYLGFAQSYMDRALMDYADPRGGGFFMTAEADGADQITRPKDSHDGAIPSGNSIALLNFVTLETIRRDGRYGSEAERLFAALSRSIRTAPAAFAQALVAADLWLGPRTEIVLAGDPRSASTRAMAREIYLRFIPNRVVLYHPAGTMGDLVRTLVPWIADQPAPAGGGTTAYVCRGGTCQLPAVSSELFRRQLDDLI